MYVSYTHLNVDNYECSLKGKDKWDGILRYRGEICA